MGKRANGSVQMPSVCPRRNPECRRIILDFGIINLYEAKRDNHGGMTETRWSEDNRGKSFGTIS
jgi:hypothetical protein